MKQKLPLVADFVYRRLTLNKAVIGDRCGDRLQTYHRSESAMNKGIGEEGDRLKEDFHFFIWESSQKTSLS